MRRKTKDNPDQGRMSEKQRTEYFQEMESIFSPISLTDQHLLNFAKDFLNTLQLSNAKDGDTVQVGPLDVRLLEYFIISIVVAYQESMWKS